MLRPRTSPLASTATAARAQLEAVQRCNEHAGSPLCPLCDCVLASLDYTPLRYIPRRSIAIPLMCQVMCQVMCRADTFRIERRAFVWSI
jgi:hypothetical protein